MEKVVKTDEEWRAELDDLAFKVLRKHGTERAHTNDNFPKDPGVFTCKGCGTPLFDQAHKFESGTGWPSFYQPMDAEMVARGMKSEFRATGQTGILVTGKGVPLDAVIADFMAGAVEYLTPDNDDDHWDHIEGQGSLFHVSYSGVTMALIHGGQPDALILCHEPTRTHMRGLPDYSLPTLEQLRDTALPMARVVNPACQVAGVSINTNWLLPAITIPRTGVRVVCTFRLTMVTFVPTN